MRRSFPFPPWAVISLAFAAFAALGSSLPAGEAPSAGKSARDARSGGKVDFVRDIQPLLAKHCVSCHGPDAQEGGLRLHSRAAAMAGGDQGEVIVPGKSAKSRLIALVTGQNDDGLQMPPDDPLPADEITLFKRWIDEGAIWPDSAAGDEPIRSDHWAFQPIARPAPPRVRQSDWVQNPIDQFVLATLEAQNLQPSPLADRHTLIRRVYLDLLGLPPTPAEVQAFISDTRPGAYERLVDRLLASPHYGERWGRHWLDLARYADSDGYEKDRARPYAWRYRQWVIEALNANMPFDHFTIKQLAGDLLPDATVEDKVATGFHRNTLTNREGGIDPEEDRVKQTIDRTNTTGAVWLGLTVGCAQCHSHKYDPFTQREYYGLYAFFDNADEADIPAPLTAAAEVQYPVAAQAPAKKNAKQQAEDAAKKGKEQAKGKAAKDEVPQAQTLVERSTPRVTRVLIRGDFLQPGPEVQPHTPAILPPLEASPGKRPNRLDLARWIMSADHPLTARVTVNRIWQRYFGQGFVGSSHDLGTQGEQPSHPELLDWLAGHFMDSGWDLKGLHRLIVTSATYRQSSAARPELEQLDPYNKLLARQNRLRVEAEIVRDLALAACGLLEPQIGGESVRPPQPADVASLGYANSVKWAESKGANRYRRGLYTFFQRTVPYPMYMDFDAPDSNEVCTRRERSNTPLSALTLQNDPVFVECAQAFARRVLSKAPRGASESRARINHALLLTLGRLPTAHEVEVIDRLQRNAQAYLTQHPEEAKALAGSSPRPAGADDAELAAWTVVGRTLLNLDEFITRE